MPDDVIEIRRYPNRRLYDRSRGAYVTLGDIEELVRGGRTVEVRDSKTGEDLTRQVLTQILLERHPDKMDLLPTALLHTMLQANDLAIEFLGNALRQSLTALEALQHPGSPFGAPMAWMSAFFPGTATAPTGAPAADDDPKALARRLAALEARIARIEADRDETGSDADPEPDDLDGLERRLRVLERRPKRRG